MTELTGKVLGMALVALCVSGCQSTVTPLALTSGTGIQAAGFTSVSLASANITTSIPTAIAAYVCAAERWGAQVVLVVGSSEIANASPTFTLESAIRANLLNSAGVRPLIEKSIFGKINDKYPGTGGRLTDFSIDSRTASLRFAGVIVEPTGTQVYLSGYGRFSGNIARTIVALSSNSRTSARYSRTAWLY